MITQGIIANKNKHGEYDIWQRRFWEHTIRNEDDLANHIDYIHYNPVKHKLVNSPKEWPYSSFHKYVALKKLSVNWAGELIKDTSFKFD